MPYRIIKNAGKNNYKVINVDTKEVKAKHTTKTKATNQIKLLNRFEKGKK